MSLPFADRLHAAVDRTGGPVCVGLDPVPARFPADWRFDRDDPAACVEAVRRFCDEVLRAVDGVAAVVKPQSAYFERYGAPGVAAYADAVQHAKEMGFVVIGDVKRGDIGPTSAAYAAAHLAGPDAADAITVNPYLGLDTLGPFLDVCTRENKGLFVLVRTSNPGSADWQDLRIESGDTLAEVIATRLNAINPGDADYGPLGAVVGATQTQTMASLRRRMPRSIFLLPGYGAQGATAEMTRLAFDGRGRGAIVSASRSVIYPDRRDGEPWPDAVRRAATAMRDDLARVVKGHVPSPGTPGGAAGTRVREGALPTGD